MKNFSLNNVIFRKKFAWLPVTIYKLNGHYIEPTKKIWMKQVTEMQTMQGSWIAYEKYQND